MKKRRVRFVSSDANIVRVSVMQHSVGGRHGSMLLTPAVSPHQPVTTHNNCHRVGALMPASLMKRKSHATRHFNEHTYSIVQSDVTVSGRQIMHVLEFNSVQKKNRKNNNCSKPQVWKLFISLSHISVLNCRVFC